MESMPLSGQHASRAFTPFLLETWSPCSHPFAILPVSAVSDAQKLATGNFLHVRARAFCVTFCTPQKVTIRFPLQGNFEVLQTSNQRTQVAGSHQLIKSLPLHGISSGRRGAAPYLYTQSVCAACFASILRRQSRSMAFPVGNISPAFEKAGQNGASGRR